MSTIVQKAIDKLDSVADRVQRVARKHDVDDQTAVERIAYRRRVLELGGPNAREMARVVLDLPS